MSAGEFIIVCQQSCGKVYVFCHDCLFIGCHHVTIIYDATDQSQVMWEPPPQSWFSCSHHTGTPPASDPIPLPSPYRDIPWSWSLDMFKLVYYVARTVSKQVVHSTPDEKLVPPTPPPDEKLVPPLPIICYTPYQACNRGINLYVVLCAEGRTT